MKFSDKIELFNVRQSGIEVKRTKFTEMLPMKGVVQSELVVGGETDMLLIKLDHDLGYSKYNSQYVIIKSTVKNSKLKLKDKTLVKVLLAYNDVDLKSTKLAKDDFRSLGKAGMVFR